MLARILLAAAFLAVVHPTALSFDLPWWVDSVEVSQPGTGGIGAVTLEGVWIDTGAPDAISHSIVDGALHLSVSAPGLNVGTGDALTPWRLTEEFGPLDPAINDITGSVFLVDPANRGDRDLVSGPDFLGWIYPPPQGEFHGLGNPSPPGYVSAAFDVSRDGRVVTGHNELAPGTAGFITREAFAWSPSTGMIPLGVLPGGVPGGSTGRGVSADGNYIVGDSTIQNDTGSFGGPEAFRWSLGGGMEPLGTIQGVSSTSEARAVSRGGRVVVGVDEFFPPTLPPGPFGSFRRAFRYTDESGTEDLGTLPAYPNGSTEAVDVSASGRVIVGTAHRGLSVTADAVFYPDLAQPFRWTRDEGMVGLGNPPRFFPAIFPSPQQETIANAVSADGSTVVGVDRILFQPFANDEFLPGAGDMAVLWTEDSGWIDLGQFHLPPGPEFVGSEAIDVSGEGRTVVGTALLFATDATGGADLGAPVDEYGRARVPFIWDRERGMRPLARVLEGDFGLDLEGWILSEVGAISDDGTTIVGTGTNPDGVQEAWRAVMYRNTRVGDANFDGAVDRGDIALLMANMGMSSETGEVYWSHGDFDEDGYVGENDMDLLAANYDGRAYGDFNMDGMIDAGDYTVWRDMLGSESPIGDSTGDGWVTHDDIAVWRANFGTSLTEAMLATAGGTVPEPTALVLLGVALLAACGWRVAR